MSRYTWTKKNLQRAKKILGQHLDKQAAAEAVSKDLGVKKSWNAINLALAKEGIKAHEALKKPVQAPKGERAPTSNDLERLLTLTKNKHLTLEELCDKLDLAPKRLRALVDDAHAAGLSLEIQGQHVGRIVRQDDERETKIHVPGIAGKSHVFAVASDIHIGSKYFLKDYFQDFIQTAYDAGARVILCPGDILDGVYKHSQFEETHHGFEEQAAYAAEVFPKLPGLVYHGITGNHDQTLEASSGIDVVRSLPDVFRRQGRNDFYLHGARGAYVRLRSPEERRGLLVELWHPGSGMGYSLSYKLQKHVDSYAPGQKPDALFAGHWHQSAYFVQRGVHSFASGTFHGQMSAFSKMLGGPAAIGGWIIKYGLTKDGAVRELLPTWRAYYEKETVREVSLG